MNDKKILVDAIKAAGLLAQAKVVWVVHPLLEEMACKFAGYAGPYAVTQAGKSLLQQCLKDAFIKYKKAMDEEGDTAAVRAFAQSLISYSVEIFSQRLVVETPKGDLGWMQFVCGADEFLAKFPDDAKVTCTWEASRISNEIASAFMMIKIIPSEMLDNDSLAELLGEHKVVG